MKVLFLGQREYAFKIVVASTELTPLPKEKIFASKGIGSNLNSAAL